MITLFWFFFGFFGFLVFLGFFGFLVFWFFFVFFFGCFFKSGLNFEVSKALKHSLLQYVPVHFFQGRECTNSLQWELTPKLDGAPWITAAVIWQSVIWISTSLLLLEALLLNLPSYIFVVLKLSFLLLVHSKLKQPVHLFWPRTTCQDVGNC